MARQLVDNLVELRANVNAVNQDRETPLFVASMAGHVDVVRLLLRSLANVYAARNDGMLAADVLSTALARANETDDPPLVSEILGREEILEILRAATRPSDSKRQRTS